ncbi:MAG: hypothetical protein B6U69_00810 [Thermofilum sp. ex4484_15]|nr:MAG: hypothetical protein B6U69_00810 [Thermofilum sp. ex4484_15]
MGNYFLLLSGEHATLPYAEVMGALEALGIHYEVLEVLPQVMRIKTEEDPCTLLAKRCSMLHFCCKEWLVCEPELKTITENLKSLDLSELRGRSIAVRVRRVGNRRIDDLASPQLERILGEIIVRREGVKVNLTNPKVKLVGVITDKFLFGPLIAEGNRGGYENRRARKKPFFHPSSFDPRLARALVNIARVKEGELVVDPFFGTGSILIEAGLVGANLLGIDIDKRMVRGGLRNLKYYEVQVIGTVRADAFNIPLRAKSADKLITDPPYGRTSSTHGRNPNEIFSRLPSLVRYLLKDKGCAVVVIPVSLIDRTFKLPKDLKVAERHRVKIHSGLIREIIMVRKEPWR